MSISLLRQLLMKEAVKKSAGSSGIMTINKNITKEVDQLLQKYVNDAMQQGVNLDSLSPDQLKMIVAMNRPKPPKVYSGQEAIDQLNNLFPKKGEVVPLPMKRTFKQEIDAMKKSGDLVDEDTMKIGEKITNREMFKNSNLNKTDTVTDTITYIKTLEPIKAMKEANSVIGRKGKYKNLTPEESKKILTDTEDHIFQRDPDNLYNYDPEDMAKGGRAGFYTGGITDVEPSLDDIGHGADAMNARTRLMSPGAQATTSTGLNYLLAEDNDNMRIPFAGGGMGRRAFLKLIASLTGGVAAAKTGILGIGGKEATKKAVTETVKQAAGSGNPPPYFFKLVEKIKLMGDDTLATQDKTIAKKYKDYTMEEDFAGNIEIIKKGSDPNKEVYMSYRVDDVPLKGKKGSTKVEEYEEFTARPDAEGKMKDVEGGVPDEVMEEGSMFEDIAPFNRDQLKADGGRIGFSAGSLAKLGINSTSRRFLEKVFGKEGFETMIQNDPRMHRGMLEVVEMFRKKDKEGLKKYMQQFLPDMDDAAIEDFIVGGKGSEGISGQLIRLGSGREYQNLMKMSKEADQIRKLDDFDIDNVSKNAEGGRIGLFMGGPLTAGKGLLKEMLKFMSKGSSNNKSPAEVLKMMNPKQFQKLLNDPRYMGKVTSEAPEGLNKIIEDMISKTKTDRSDMVGNIIGTSRKIKQTDDNIIKYKMTIIEDMMSKGIDRETAEKFAENLASQVSKAAGKKPTPKITEQGLLELENIQKNIITKDRKLQAQGGLTTMLGE